MSDRTVAFVRLDKHTSDIYDNPKQRIQAASSPEHNKAGTFQRVSRVNLQPSTLVAADNHNRQWRRNFGVTRPIEIKVIPFPDGRHASITSGAQTRDQIIE